MEAYKENSVLSSIYKILIFLVKVYFWCFSVYKSIKNMIKLGKLDFLI